MKNFVILFLLVAGSLSAVAQDGYTSLHYDISFGLGNTHDFISQASFRGVGFDYRSFVTDNIGVGLTFGYYTFYGRADYATYTLPDGATSLTGVQYRYINAVPLHLSTNYYFGESDAAARPFVGLGIGTTFSERRTEMGQYSTSTNSWQFSLQPEVGVLYQVQSDAYLFMAGKFTAPFQNTTFASQPFLSLNFGMAWALH